MPVLLHYISKRYSNNFTEEFHDTNAARERVQFLKEKLRDNAASAVSCKLTKLTEPPFPGDKVVLTTDDGKWLEGHVMGSM